MPHVARQRRLVGPDLSNLAGRRKIYSIRDALTKTEHLVATDGGRHDLSLTPLNTYMGSDNELHMFARDELREVVYEPKSLMPTDYDKRLTSEEFQDLLAFLSHQAVSRPK